MSLNGVKENLKSYVLASGVQSKKIFDRFSSKFSTKCFFSVEIYYKIQFFRQNLLQNIQLVRLPNKFLNL